MSQYLLLLHHDISGFQQMSPEEMQKAVEKYMTWTKKPFVVNSQRLAPEPGRVIRSQNGSLKTTDGPYSETKEVLGGFYLIEAATYDAAVKLALENPHTDYGAAIEIRQLYSQ